MKRRGGDFEGETDQRHDDAGGEQRLDWPARELLPDGGKAGRSRHAIDEADPKKRERARRAAEEEIFQARFGGADVGFVERGHDIKREAG